MLLGEQITPQAERFHIQFKGSGRTPYSQGGDGRAGLGPMLREFIISGVMHALSIPITRSLAMVTTGELVLPEAAVEHGDYSVMERSLEVLSKPYAHTQEQKDFCTVPAETAQPY